MQSNGGAANAPQSNADAQIPDVDDYLISNIDVQLVMARIDIPNMIYYILMVILSQICFNNQFMMLGQIAHGPWGRYLPVELPCERHVKILT